MGGMYFIGDQMKVEIEPKSIGLGDIVPKFESYFGWIELLFRFHAQIYKYKFWYVEFSILYLISSQFIFYYPIYEYYHF